MSVTRTFTTAYASQVEYAKVSAKYWKERARIKWNIEGDTCSKYFFNWVKGKAGMNYIAGIKMDNGEWNFDTGDIMGLFVHYYSGLFKEGVNEVSFDEYYPYVKNLFFVNKEFLSPDDSDTLGIHFTPKEVRTTVFQLGPLKSLGPDGIPAIFFHKCWHFIKHDVIGTVLAILNGNSSPEFLNKTFLVLIPKSSAPETVDNFHPISLCNVIMKIFTRCITNRLKKFMGKLVGDFQNAFVPRRNIGDNILITNEILHQISSSKNGRMGRMAFKADMSKAYDRLDSNFIRGNSKSCVNLDKVIMDYCHASGQVINDNKSSMTLSSCSSLSFARKCLKTFNISCGTNMGSYLGIPTDVGLSGCNKSRRKIFEFIIDKVRKRLSSWNCVLLSSAGRLALISSVLSSLSVDFLSVFISVTKRLDAILSHFWRAGHKKSPSISWCSRLFLSQPKRNGGLDIRRMKEFNQALLAKIGWRMIIYPDSILSKSIGAKYGLRWQDGELLFNDGKTWNISPLSDLCVWNTKWVNGRVPKPLCLEFLTDPPDLSNLKIKNLISNNSCWDRRLVSMFFDETSMRDILAIPIRCSEGMDNFFWSASSSENYSVKIGYHIALKNLWNTSATPKDRSRVPAAWNNLNLQSLVCNWLSVLFKADNKQEACLSFLCIIWTIWVVRCRKVFDNCECSPTGAILLYQDFLNLALLAEDRKSGFITFQTPLEEDLTNLRNGALFPLVQGSLNCPQSLIYVDAAWSKDLAAGLGGCIMFENEVVSEFCIKGSAENAEQAEVLAIREALKWALSHNILHITIFSDCLQVLAQVLKFSQLKHWTRNTVEDITELPANFHCVSFAYVPRICNKAAHRLAKRAIKL
ncbi:uncharacterized protein LOC141651008 [Silene latifolia]|uniref:uncharacterized protein LOC141651008 n=1 Tax=Silene latifolia TaxID=37657 RepID=UPI003D7802FD